MVYVTFSQRWAKVWYKDRMMKLWREVVTASTPDLWLKIFFYRDKVWFTPVDQKRYQYDQKLKKNVEVPHHGFKMMDAARVFFGDRYNFDEMTRTDVFPCTSCRGHYRCALPFGHGFYDQEWDFINSHQKIKHCITLKIGESATDRNIAGLMAHEYRHYRQWKKYGPHRLNAKFSSNGRRPIQVEKDAERWATKRLKVLGHG